VLGAVQVLHDITIISPSPRRLTASSASSPHHTIASPPHLQPPPPGATVDAAVLASERPWTDDVAAARRSARSFQLISLFWVKEQCFWSKLRAHGNDATPTRAEKS
jgi:hypothetical protein